MCEPLLSSLSMKSHHLSTVLSIEPAGANAIDPSKESTEQNPIFSRDINLPLSCDRKSMKRVDSIWGAWFFFNFYFKPILSDKSKKPKIIQDGNVSPNFDKSDLKLEAFLVQHDMENMYMWVLKERPENALGKMQLRSYMNGHCRSGEPRFPFGVDRGFVRSHRMQRKHYRGLSNPQCIHGIELVRLPILTSVSEAVQKKWAEITGRDLNFTIPLEASDFGSWRNLAAVDFELARPLLLKNNVVLHQRRQLYVSDLNLSNEQLDHDVFDHCSQRPLDTDIHFGDPLWINEFSDLMRYVHGPVTAAKTIYEDEESYLIVVSLPLSDQHRVKVCWRNNVNHGVVKISCFSTGRMPCLKRHDRTFVLADSSDEHCPPGEFVREIHLATRIPDDANIEAYYDETGTILEIMVPKHRVGPEEHEVHVSMRPPHLGTNELMLT